jgi:cytochrome c2
MKRITKFTLLVAALLIVAPLWMRGGRLDFRAEAQPSWSRKYNAKCTLCHTTYPRLNRTGYQFKRLGYRMPQEVEAQGKKHTPTATQTSGTEHKPFVVKPTGYQPEPASRSSERGRAIFESLNCSRCHSVAGNGGSIGPPLDGVGARRDRDFLLAHLTTLKSTSRSFRSYMETHRPSCLILTQRRSRSSSWRIICLRYRNRQAVFW